MVILNTYYMLFIMKNNESLEKTCEPKTEKEEDYYSELNRIKDQYNNPIKYITQKIFSTIRECTVKNPDDINYLFSQKLAQGLNSSDKTKDKITYEGVTLGLYKLLETIEKALRK